MVFYYGKLYGDYKYGTRSFTYGAVDLCNAGARVAVRIKANLADSYTKTTRALSYVE